MVIISNDKRLTIDEDVDEEDNKSYAETLLDGGDLEFQEWCDKSGSLYFKLDYHNFQSYIEYVLNHLSSQIETDATSSAASTNLRYTDIVSSAEESGTEVDFGRINDANHPAAFLGRDMLICIKVNNTHL